MEEEEQRRRMRSSNGDMSYIQHTRVEENKNARRKAYEKAIKTCLIPFIAFFNCRVCMSDRIHLSLPDE